jgi:hypothetical protein
MDSLLDQAKAVKIKQGPRTDPDAQMAALAVGCAFDEVSFVQASKAAGRQGNSMYAALWRGIKDAARLGLLVRGPATKGGKR